MNVIDFNKQKNIRMKAKARAFELHDRMLALAGNPEVLIDFIEDNGFDNELSKIIYEAENHLQNKEDDHDR